MRIADFRGAADITVGINVNSASLILHEKSGNENNKKEYFRVIYYDEGGVNKSTE